jgi:hypothetical protein
MTDKLFDQISDRVDTIQEKVDFLLEIEMRIDSILSSIFDAEDEEIEIQPTNNDLLSEETVAISSESDDEISDYAA